MPELSLIIVSYNVKAYLEACLRSVFAGMDVPFEIIVVDNHSRDGSVDMVRKAFPDVRCIPLNTNVGFAAANNIGIGQSSGSLLLFLNPDTELAGGGLKGLLRFFDDHPRAAAAGCRTLNTDGTLQRTCYTFPSLREMIAMFFPFPGRYTPLRDMDYSRGAEVDYVRGSFMAVRRRSLEAVGTLDPRFFMYGEEADLCFRLQKAGWKCFYVPEPVIIHHKGKSTEQVGGGMSPERIRSLLVYFRKHHPGQVPVVRAAVIFGSGFRLLFKGFTDRRRLRRGFQAVPANVYRGILKEALNFDFKKKERHVEDG